MYINKQWEWNKIKEHNMAEPAEDIYWLAQYWKAQDYDAILDLGCGFGRHALFFAEKGFSVYAHDLSREGLQKLQHEADAEGVFIKSSMGYLNELPYDDNFFDAVLSYHVIYHNDTDGMKKTIDELYRVLKPNGNAYLSLISKNDPSYKDDEYETIDENVKVKYSLPEDGIPHYYFNINQIQSLFSMFEIRRIKQVESFVPKRHTNHYFILIEKR